MTYLDLNLRLPELLLMRVDKMSMGVSPRGARAVPRPQVRRAGDEHPDRASRRKNGELKHILKKAVRGLIPDELIDRPKQGFGVPVYEWFFGALGERTERELDTFCGETDFLDRRAVARLIEQKQGPQLWYLLNLALWWKHFIAGEPSLLDAPASASIRPSPFAEPAWVSP